MFAVDEAVNVGTHEHVLVAFAERRVRPVEAAEHVLRAAARELRRRSDLEERVVYAEPAESSPWNNGRLLGSITGRTGSSSFAMEMEDCVWKKFYHFLDVGRALEHCVLKKFYRFLDVGRAFSQPTHQFHDIPCLWTADLEFGPGNQGGWMQSGHTFNANSCLKVPRS